ncbi:MAG: YtxH domain-containing protein [Candidatus Levybacteria bacterium]|nr:YtxH domain-containing protein [Candidatus Levybacteria bacterium]MDZ4228441.1 YtxH domain-containing protein [Candidatus Levybacteria bacterium]
MENSNNKSGNNFLSGFLLGVLIGGVVVFLLGTKKGKKILKAISEEGEGKISSIINKLENSVDLEDESLEDDDSSLLVQPSSSLSSAQTFRRTSRPTSNASEKLISREKVIEKKPKARRFFRGISRHN